MAAGPAGIDAPAPREVLSRWAGRGSAARAVRLSYSRSVPQAGVSPDLADSPGEPFALFDAWYAEAVECEEIRYAHAVCLSTTGLDGLPDARMVLLKLHDPSGFVFFTDSRSVKGRSLGRLPEAAMTFYWAPLDRQVRIRGRVEVASDEVSDRCFGARPRAAQITAWASRQSRELDAEDLGRRVESYTERFADAESVPRPPHWRAYRLVPRAVEFWVARGGRLHDRLLYGRDDDGGWTVQRLEP